MLVAASDCYQDKHWYREFLVTATAAENWPFSLSYYLTISPDNWEEKATKAEQRLDSVSSSNTVFTIAQL